MKGKMIYTKDLCVKTIVLLSMTVMALALFPGTLLGRDLDAVKQNGVLRHLGIPYANFITGSGDGMDVELMMLFAKHLGVKYEFVKTDWGEIFGDLTGKTVKPKGDNIEIIGSVPVKGDVAANGITVLPWRQKIVDFSVATFPIRSGSLRGPSLPSNLSNCPITSARILRQ